MCVIMGGSNVKALGDAPKINKVSHKISKNKNNGEDDVVDFQMDDVVSKLQHKQLVTKVAVKGAIGREGDVIVLRPEAAVLNAEEEESGSPFLAVELHKSQVQQYSLPDYIPSEVQAKVPSKMFVTVVRDLLNEGNANGPGRTKVDDTRTVAPPVPRARHEDAKKYYGSPPPPSKDDFTVKTFVEKYSARGSEHVEAAVRSLARLGAPSTAATSKTITAVSARVRMFPPGSADTTSASSRSPLQRNSSAGSSKPSQATTSQLWPRAPTTGERAAAPALSDSEGKEDRGLIQKLLKLHGQGVDVPPPREGDEDSDASDEDECGGERTAIHLSDDSSDEDDLYQKSLLQFSPVNSAALLHPPSGVPRRRGEGPRINHEYEDEDEEDSSFDEGSGSSYTDDDDDTDDDSSEEEEEEEQDDEDFSGAGGGATSVGSGESMSMHDLLQFSRSFVEARELSVPHCGQDSRALSDDEEDAELYSKRVLANQRLAELAKQSCQRSPVRAPPRAS